MDGDVLGFERRRWSEERKREIVLASFAPGDLSPDFPPVLGRVLDLHFDLKRPFFP